MYAHVFWLPKISIGQKKYLQHLLLLLLLQDAICIETVALKRHEKDENKIAVMLSIGTSSQVPALLFHIYSVRRSIESFTIMGLV